MPRKPVVEPVRPMNLRVEEAATIIGIGRTAAYELVRTGALRSFKIGKLRRVPREEAERYARELASDVGQAA
jgi:excisionase family DNA binding protein